MKDNHVLSYALGILFSFCLTNELMAYLRGDREDLHVPTIVDGQPREFFNDREIAHMEDVRGLFVRALVLRRASSRHLSAWLFCGF